MVINMMGNGLITKNMVKELIYGQMEENIKGNMLMINNKAKE